MHEALKERAKQNGRSMNAEVVRIFERGLGVIEVPIVGKIEHGRVSLDAEYQDYLKSPLDPRD